MRGTLVDTETTEDGNLPQARRNLSNAISQLIDPKPHTHHGAIRWAESLYQQLIDAIPGAQGTRSAVPQSSPPLNLAAAELKAEIDQAAAIWEPRPDIDRDDHITVIRLQALNKRGWRPQDVSRIDQLAANLRSWCRAIAQELDPAPDWSLPSPCPACGTTIVYRRNSSGEQVRKPALSIGPGGCECLKCHATWAPEKFVFLAGVLGYELPDGVLE